MENVVLIIHLILALCLIGVVLLQRSEGGGLGMGGGGGGGVMTGRSAATALAKLTWVFAAAFICTSIVLTFLASQGSGGSSVIDQIGGTAPVSAPVAPSLPEGGNLLPPSSSDAPATPPRADDPATPPPAE
ncbi:MAG: preprotein translocase subunit SecG [Cereibacter sphaeroides]|uniref:Protein-export membrane protein SecG n=1 Tax=Cereibacter sphaeroides TaxID=1063 RepID=A0A2W5U0T8_CERSP|nr:MAG: preprotein translocase subunit SecG [Cereibacter sphaeroides]